MANALLIGGRITLGLVGAWLALTVQAGGTRFVVPGSQAAKEPSCVEPTEYMRRNHMEVIKHQRDETVHGGIRSTKHSLAGCVACHVAAGTDGKPVAINEDQQFCGKCHDFAAVRLNCFDCHAKVPAPLQPRAGGGRGLAAPPPGTWQPPTQGAPLPAHPVTPGPALPAPR